jgi:hypothetical protein
MSAIEVLAPLRLETRFVAPADRGDGPQVWQLRLRIYPDDLSFPEPVTPPTDPERARLAEVIEALNRPPPTDGPGAGRRIDTATAFAAFASAVGPSRAYVLWRTLVVTDATGVATIRPTEPRDHARLQVDRPVGLPEHLEVWLVHRDGRRELAETVRLDRPAIAADLDLEAIAAALEPEGRPPDARADASARAWAAGTLPRTWWLDHERAVEVGLAVDLDLAEARPALDALVVVGAGDTSAADLIDLHAAGGRMALLPPGTPTNTVQGETTTDLGSAEALGRLLTVDLDGQAGTRAVMTALTGGVADDALPLLGGRLDQRGPGAAVVQALWPVLWGRALRDVIGGGAVEVDLAQWAIDHLAVEGPLPAIRIGDQPYSLLPTSAFRRWVATRNHQAAPGDELADLETRLLAWALPWRDGAAAAAREAARRVQGADARGLLAVLGLHAPNRHWRLRPVAPLPALQAARAMVGMAPLPTSTWDRDTAHALADRRTPRSPIAPAARSGRLAGPVDDVGEDAARWLELLGMEPEALYHAEGLDDLGLIGRLVRQSLICARAIVGEAAERQAAGRPISLDAALPMDDESTYQDHVMFGSDDAASAIAGESFGDVLELRFQQVRDGIEELVHRWEHDPERVLGAVLAALDTATVRVDPWLVGVADRRLQAMTARAAPRYLGAYGWVDAPAPYEADTDARLAPGPTAAGLLHAPSDTQALAAAVLRDAAVRYPDDDRWDVTIDSAKVRHAVALAERVRLGVHPYEALGLEVERLAGATDVVRELRRNYPLSDDAPLRRVCDGAAVLRDAREGKLPASVPADLAETLEPLDDVLDTYADLLVADGVHAFVTGRADLAQAAMEAAAGLGAPPELRAVRTARGATTVRVATWVALPSGDAPSPVPPPPVAGTPTPPGLAHPVAVADPAFVALVSSETGVDLTADGEDPGAPERVTALANLLGGGEDEPMTPALTDELREAADDELIGRAAQVRRLLERSQEQLAAMDVSAEEAVADIEALAVRWAVDLTAVGPDDPDREAPSAEELRTALDAALTDRLRRADDGIATARSAIAAIRLLVGRRWLPVLPVVPSVLLPPLRSAPDTDRTWLEVVAAVRPRLAVLEAHQLHPGGTPWHPWVWTPDGSIDPWHRTGPVLVTYGPAGLLDEPASDQRVAIAVLDTWDDAVPSRRHVTSAAFGFNAPKARAPQAVLLAVPPDPSERMTSSDLLDVVLETRELVCARAAGPRDLHGLPYATPAPLVHASGPASFLEGWPP